MQQSCFQPVFPSSGDVIYTQRQGQAWKLKVLSRSEIPLGAGRVMSGGRPAALASYSPSDRRDKHDGSARDRCDRIGCHQVSRITQV
jgi:hypothetical protein